MSRSWLTPATLFALAAAGAGACNQLIGAGPPIVVAPDRAPCQLDADCAHDTCGPSGACLPASCRTGGVFVCKAACEPCADSLACEVNLDCASGACTPGGTCVPASCAVGGSFVCGEGCEPCPNFAACDANLDCASQACDAAHGECVPATCQTSPGVFTCGAECGKCDDNAPCEIDADCASATCRAARCIPATCFNLQPDGDEEGTDCGGSCFAECSPCKKKQDCAGAPDCCDPDDLGCCSNDAGCCAENSCSCI